MRIVVQRVKNARLLVDSQVVCSIDKGLVALCGLTEEDSEDDLPWMCSKLLNMRLWPDSEGVGWKESVVSSRFEVMLVSQFTLYGAVNKGTKPNFMKAMKGDAAETLYKKWVQLVKKEYVEDKVFDGVFRAMMDVELVNDGPVTIVFDSPDRSSTSRKK